MGVDAVGQQVVDARHERNPAVDALGGEIELFLALLVAQGEELARGSADDDAVRAVLDLPVNDPAERLVVDRQIIRERRNDRDINALNLHPVLPPGV